MELNKDFSALLGVFESVMLGFQKAIFGLCEARIDNEIVLNERAEDRCEIRIEMREVCRKARIPRRKV